MWLHLVRIGLEAGPLSQWLHAGLVGAGLPAVLVETRHVKAALSAMTVKTDRNDARGIAQLIRMGWFRPVHAKALPAQEVRTLLTGRKLLQSKLLDLEGGIRGMLRGFGLKVGPVGAAGFERRIRELVTGQTTLERVMEPMLRARQALRSEFMNLHRDLLRIVRTDDICRRLMTVPGVGGSRRDPAGRRGPHRRAVDSGPPLRGPRRATRMLAGRWPTPIRKSPTVPHPGRPATAGGLTGGATTRR